jgi:hypothetical protein
LNWSRSALTSASRTRRMEQADSSELTNKALRATSKPADQPPLRRPNPSSHPLRGGCLTGKITLAERDNNLLSRSVVRSEPDAKSSAAQTRSGANRKRIATGATGAQM